MRQTLEQLATQLADTQEDLRRFISEATWREVRAAREKGDLAPLPPAVLVQLQAVEELSNLNLLLDVQVGGRARKGLTACAEAGR